MELISVLKIRDLVQIILVGTFACVPNIVLAAKPLPPPGRIVFLGYTSNGLNSVWLSETEDGIFEVEAQKQIVDEWVQPQPGLHVTVSPNIHNPHSLFEVIDGEMVFIDKDNQQGGITFPPFPGGLPPEVTPPIALPPVYTQLIQLCRRRPAKQLHLPEQLLRLPDLQPRHTKALRRLP